MHQNKRCSLYIQMKKKKQQEKQIIQRMIDTYRVILLVFLFLFTFLKQKKTGNWKFQMKG